MPAIDVTDASKFESEDGIHATKLSRVLTASQLPASSVVVTVNRKLHADDGWELACDPIEGPMPHETAGVGTAYFWWRRGD